jgi:hypothetical protein
MWIDIAGLLEAQVFRVELYTWAFASVCQDNHIVGYRE